MSQVHIERFTSWDEIFPNSSEEARHYQDLLSDLQEDYGDKVSQRVEIDPETGLASITFDGNGVHTILQRLSSRNIKIQFRSGHISEIVPEIGNKKHPWTYDDIRFLRSGIMDLYSQTQDSAEKMRLYITFSNLKGKVASGAWEETFLYNNRYPQRIGYKIYVDEALKGA